MRQPRHGTQRETSDRGAPAHDWRAGGGGDLQRYKRLLLEKRRELSSAHGNARALVPTAGRWEGDVIDQANADVEAEL